MKYSRHILLILALLAGCAIVVIAVFSNVAPDVPIQTQTLNLRDVTRASGVTFQHTDGGSGKKYIVEYVSAGLATFDYDSDGLIDIYFVNGAPLQGSTIDAPSRNVLYRNLGSFQFQDVTEQAGVGDTGYGLGATVGDFDNDGAPDLYVSNYGPNVLYHNNGDGTFSEVTDSAGVNDGQKVGAGVAWLDIESDGDLDLYVANYVDFRYETYQPRIVEALHVYPGPMEFDPVPDVLFRNNGDGTFSDVTEESGIDDVAGSGMGIVCADSDDDGDTDIFVLNDVAQNYFFENDGNGHFDEVSVYVSLAYNGEGHTLGSMGVDCGDYDNDGRLDFFQTSYSAELPVLFRNLGDSVFEDVTIATGAGSNTLPHVNWGVGFVDLDNDADRDLFFANGHLQDNIEDYDSAAFYRARNTVLLNTGDGRFIDVSRNCGNGLDPEESSRGVALDDLDNDGRVDIVVLNSRGPATIIRNEPLIDSHWIEIQLHGVNATRDGIGAHVTVTTPDGRKQLQEAHAGRGYQSHFGSRLHFGLGEEKKIDSIQVRWLGGDLQTWNDIPADRRIILIEGKDPFFEGRP